MSFEWQTEDERSWDQPDAPSEDSNGQPSRRWPWVLLVVVLLASGAYYTWQQVQERVDEATEVVRDEVRTSYSLARRAALQQDEELFVTLLSGRSAMWTETQKERVARGLLFEETSRILDFEPAGEALAEPAVELNPELTEAVLTVAQPVTVDAGAGLTETVVLTQTHVFRQGSQRWLLSPPTEEFWGGAWRTHSGDALRLTYRPRDEDLARRLGDDLERKLLEMCRTLMSCPDDFRMSLRLESDVQSVLFAADGEQRLSGDRELILPGPTLVGLPVDEAAYAALFRGYAAHLISAAMVRVLEYSCCETVLYQEALLDWQLSRLNLRSAPIDTGDYLYLVDAPTSIDHMIALARPTAPLGPGEEAPPEVHAFIDFLRSRLSMRRDPLLDLHRSLTRNGSFWAWVSFSTEYQAGNPSMLWSDWSAFMWEKAREAQELAQPLPPDLAPQQDLVALCGGENELDLYHYSLATGEWSREIDANFEYAVVAPFPDGNGYMASGQSSAQDGRLQYVSYVRPESGAHFSIAQQEPNGVAFFPWDVSDTAGEHMVVWLFSPSGEDGLLGNALLDPSSCTPDGCDLERLPGIPIWSPTGRLALAIDNVDQGLLYLPADRTQWQEIDAAVAAPPQWLDENSFVFVEQQGNVRHSTLRLFNIADDEASEIVTSDSLRALLEPSGQASASFWLAWAGPHPYRDNTILVLGAAADIGESYLFAVSPSAGQAFATAAEPQISLLETFQGTADQLWFGASYRQTERYLVISMQRTSGRGTTIYDLQTQETVLASAVSAGDGFRNGNWSLDENWFAHSMVRAIDILRPTLQNEGRPYRQLIFHDFDYCTSPAWANRQ